MIMPRYVYTCNDCGHKDQDQFHSYGDDHGPCITCGKLNLTKQLGAPALRPYGMASMSVKHTTTETFGAHPKGGQTKIGHVESFPEEVSAKIKEHQKKMDGKGATVGGKPISKKIKQKK
jgi:putative FmdB family regulatory protein